MRDYIREKVDFLQWLLYKKFKESSEEVIEIMLMLSVGHIFGIYSVNEFAEILDIGKSKLYEELKSWSIYKWRQMLVVIGSELALEELKKLGSKSDATKSRKCITISVDDTVIDRYGKLLSLTYNWWSGRWHKIVKGQNILGIVIKIGDIVIPLGLRPVGKQGCSNTSKPEIFETLIEEVKEFFKKAGIDITKYPITFDSWYGSKELVEILREKGFSEILIVAKSNYVFEIEGVKKTLSEHKKSAVLEEGQWGCADIPCVRYKARNPTFGETILLIFQQCKQIKAIMKFGKKLRSCEILRIWSQHQGIEQFWKSLKSIVKIHRMSLRGREGCYAGIALKLLAYLLMLLVSKKFHFSLYRLQLFARKNLNLFDFFSKHFHSIRS